MPTNKEIETLNSAAEKSIGVIKMDEYNKSLRMAYFIKGANWQKEQYKPIVSILTKISKGERYTIDEINEALNNIQ